MDGRLNNMTSIYILQEDKILLLYRIGSREVSPSWCGIGGHFEKEELNDARACVLRELYEELGVPESDLSDIHLKYVTLRLRKGRIRQNYYFFAWLRPEASVRLSSDEGIPKWFRLDELDGLEMPFTAKYVLRHYLETGRHTSDLYSGTAEPDGVRFIPLREFP
ncbi:MAG TPA: NUDIX domain-containing protein [Candidatus Eisenbergiella merdavium]|uniref:NUDIX domain-containing protein n=1 Tax=Candidatus Eisenbergiella merdavium TaxID=2838551 RepID=A0A9D2SPI8_9FIRM|nr:NUDIX domain-containing protein [Candidatus Eisenbergiella merdavium]